MLHMICKLAEEMWGGRAERFELKTQRKTMMVNLINQTPHQHCGGILTLSGRTLLPCAYTDEGWEQ